MDSHFLLNALHIFRWNIRNVDNFARVDWLSDIRGRSIALLFTRFDHLIGNFLGFHDFAILAFAELLVDVDEEPIYFAHVGLFFLRSLLRRLFLELWLLLFAFLASLILRLSLWLCLHLIKYLIFILYLKMSLSKKNILDGWYIWENHF